MTQVWGIFHQFYSPPPLPGHHCTVPYLPFCLNTVTFFLEQQPYPTKKNMQGWGKDGENDKLCCTFLLLVGHRGHIIKRFALSILLPGKLLCNLPCPFILLLPVFTCGKYKINKSYFIFHTGNHTVPVIKELLKTSCKGCLCLCKQVAQ